MSSAHILLWIGLLLGPAAADIAPMPRLYRVIAQHSLLIEPHPDHAFFLVAFPGPQFNSEAFAMLPLPEGAMTPLMLSSNDLSQLTEGIRFPHNHAFIVALSSVQQDELRELIAAHPALNLPEGGALTLTHQDGGFGSAEGQAIRAYLLGENILHLERPVSAWMTQGSQQPPTLSHHVMVKDGALLLVTED